MTDNGELAEAFAQVQDQPQVARNPVSPAHHVAGIAGGAARGAEISTHEYPDPYNSSTVKALERHPFLGQGDPPAQVFVLGEQIEDNAVGNGDVGWVAAQRLPNRRCRGPRPWPWLPWPRSSPPPGCRWPRMIRPCCSQRSKFSWVAPWGTMLLLAISTRGASSWVRKTATGLPLCTSSVSSGSSCSRERRMASKHSQLRAPCRGRRRRSGCPGRRPPRGPGCSGACGRRPRSASSCRSVACPGAGWCGAWGPPGRGTGRNS